MLESQVETVKRNPRRPEAEREFKVWRKESRPRFETKIESEIAQSVIQNATIF